jgi:hypothetical protein
VKTRYPANPLRNHPHLFSFRSIQKLIQLNTGTVQRDEVRAGGIRSGYAKVSNSRAGSCRFKKDLNRALGARSESLTAVILLREVDTRGDDLVHSDIRFRRIGDCERVRRTLGIYCRFAEIDFGSRNLQSSNRCLGVNTNEKREGYDDNDCRPNLPDPQCLLPSGGLSPKIAVPRRTQVEPSSIAISKSCDMPIERTCM